MFGLEKGKKALFEFDLEKELKNSPEKAKQTLRMVEEKIHEIKELLRKGEGSEEFEELGVILHGFVSLQKVLSKIGKN